MIDANIDLSVIKRRTDDRETVVQRLKDEGFSMVDEGMGRTVLESPEGLSFCVREGFAGTWIVPSGPIRGTLFSNRAVGYGIDREVGNNNNGNSDDTVTNNSSRGSNSDVNHVV